MEKKNQENIQLLSKMTKRKKTIQIEKQKNSYIINKNQKESSELAFSILQATKI